MTQFFPIFSLLFCVNLQAQDTFNIADRINTQSYFLENYNILFGNPNFSIVTEFTDTINKSPQKEKALILVKKLDDLLPPKLLMPLIYWRSIEENRENLARVISFSIFYKALILRDIIDSPLSSKELQLKALSTLREINDDDSLTSQNLASKLLPQLKLIGQQISLIESDEIFLQAFKETKALQFDLKESFSQVNQYILSYLGFIPGNQVQVISENRRDTDRMKWVNERVIFAGGELDWDAPHIQMPTLENSNTGNPILLDPIFMKIRDMIHQANDSIFIDIFLFGGTMGATIAEYLVEEIKKKYAQNPNFRALLLHDYATNYNLKEEIMPIFQYIKNRISADKNLAKCFFLLQANIQRHPPGIPFGITKLVPRTPEFQSYIQTLNTHPESKIDHSKIIVIDANTNHPQAYFGSKNWSDHSGSYYYDDAIHITGPGAALAQASYFRDIEAALTEIPEELAEFYFQKEGLDNKHLVSRKKEILDAFKINKEIYPHIGAEKIRIAEADVDGTVKNVRNILIDMIHAAQKNIFMEQLFIYDPYIVDALIKKKIQFPDIDIKVLADNNKNFGLNGLPNTLFIKEMLSYGIELRARKLLNVKSIFPDGTEKIFHQENHRKVTSVDGRIFLGGSSNTNPDTFQGSFREFGAQIFEREEIQEWDKRFLRSWYDLSKTESFNIENFQINIGGKTLSPPESALLNDFGATLYRSKDGIEKRH